MSRDRCSWSPCLRLRRHERSARFAHLGFSAEIHACPSSPMTHGPRFLPICLVLSTAHIYGTLALICELPCAIRIQLSKMAALWHTGRIYRTENVLLRRSLPINAPEKQLRRSSWFRENVRSSPSPVLSGILCKYLEGCLIHVCRGSRVSVARCTSLCRLRFLPARRLTKEPLPLALRRSKSVCKWTVVTRPDHGDSAYRLGRIGAVSSSLAREWVCHNGTVLVSTV